MSVRRILLVVFGVGTVCGYALLPVADMLSTPGRPPSALFGVAGMVITFSALGALITAFKHAEALNRDPGGWALASFLFPYVVPFVLASRKRISFNPGRAARRRIRVIGDEVVVRTGVFGSVRLSLANLRLVTLSAPAGESRWKWKPSLGPLALESRRGIEFHHLDLMTDGNEQALLTHYRRVFDELKDRKGRMLPDRKRLKVMSIVKLHLEGYDTTRAQVTFEDILSATDDLLAALHATRARRVERLHTWLATSPEVIVGTALTKSGRATLSHKGIRCGKELLPWQGVKSVGITERSIEIELREPPSRWARTWSIPVAKSSFMTAAADFFFWLHLARSANAEAPNADQYDAIVSLLDGKGVCTGCNTIGDIVPGRPSVCCQKPELSFRRAEKMRTCSRCGTGLSDETFGLDTQMGELIARNGFVCPACGLSACLPCTTTNASDHAVFSCACGAPLAIRL